jgi:hypothetical protein
MLLHGAHGDVQPFGYLLVGATAGNKLDDPPLRLTERRLGSGDRRLLLGHGRVLAEGGFQGEGQWVRLALLDKIPRAAADQAGEA